MSIENRKNPRYPAAARAKIGGVTEVEVLLKDLSVTGCGIESTIHLDLTLNSVFTITVYPESASGIGSFDLEAEARWIHASDYSFGAGFAVIRSPKGRLFQRYIDYLGWRAAQGAGSSGL